MEIFELRYFLGVAEHENLHKASLRLNVSPGSLSKAITRLEDELNVKLFVREGRNIRLSEHGKLLQARASEIIHLEESTKMQIAGRHGTLNVVIVGPEILLSNLGQRVVQRIKKKYSHVKFEFRAEEDDESIALVEDGVAHLAISSSLPSTDKKLVVHPLCEVLFQTCAGEGHPLYTFAKNGKAVSIEEVLKHPFVSSRDSLFGKVTKRQSADGWREDQFPRRVDYIASSIKIIEEIVEQGDALAHLPDYFIKKMNALPLKITGCPYSCQQKIRLISRNPKEVSWLNQIF